MRAEVGRPAARHAGCGERAGRFACPPYRDGVSSENRTVNLSKDDDPMKGYRNDYDSERAKR